MLWEIEPEGFAESLHVLWCVWAGKDFGVTMIGGTAECSGDGGAQVIGRPSCRVINHLRWGRRGANLVGLKYDMTNPEDENY